MQLKKHIFITFSLIFILNYSSFGQGFQVTGKVTEDNNEGIPGVTVVEKGSTNGAVTNLEGEYSITLQNSSSALVFSFIGFDSQEITYNGQTVVDVTLKETISELDEVVVIGYGTQKKKVLTGAIESISSEDIASTPVVRIDQALQGRAAGVQVVNQSGQPGEQPSIKVRGIGSDYNADPLFLVDGMTVNSIDNLNPGDIESIEVLKDAASASIYGARAANGVVLITTKKGSAGKTSVTYSGYYGIQKAAKKVDLLDANEYVSVMARAGMPGFDPNEIPQYNTDWQEELFTSAPIESHQISVIGGSEKTSSAASASYFKQEGIIGGERSKFERYTARLNNSTKVNNWFSWGSMLSYARILTRGVVSNGSFNGAFGSALNLDPLTPVFETNQAALSRSPYSTQPVVTADNGNVYGISEYVIGEIVNPLAKLQTQNQLVSKDQILGNMYAEISPIEDLKIRSSVGIDLSYLKIASHQDLFYLSNTTNNTVSTSLSKEYQRNISLQFENTASYSKKIDKHNFNILVGFTFLKRNWENLTGSGQDINTDNADLLYLSLATDSTQRAGDAANEYRLGSYFSRLLYDYNDRVSFSLTYRRDGSSQFGPNNPFASFWSFGSSWVINEEPFFPEISFLSFLKLRASWGQNGNDRIRDFQYTSTVDFSTDYNFSNGIQNGATSTNVENADIKWETAEQLNFGIESGFLENKLLINLDYYSEVTKDLLQPAIGLSSLGLPLAWANVGTMLNKGFEFSGTWRDTKGKLGYSVGINAAYNKNEMVEIASEAGFLPGASWALAGEVTRTIEGHPVTSFYGFKTDGIFQSTLDVFSHINSEGDPIQPSAEAGDIRYVDVNGDGKISDDDRTIIGSPIPNWTLGTNVSLNYKSFDCTIFFNGQFGNDVFDGSNRPDIPTSNRQKWMLDSWTSENPSSTVPRFVANDVNENYTRATDLVNIQNGSFVRLKNIQVGYNLSQRIINKFKCQNWRLYVSAENVLTFTSYRGADPEVGAPVDFDGSGTSSITDMGIDRGIYPQARTFRLGTTITF